MSLYFVCFILCLILYLILLISCYILCIKYYFRFQTLGVKGIRIKECNNSLRKYIKLYLSYLYKKFILNLISSILNLFFMFIYFIISFFYSSSTSFNIYL